MDEIKKYISNNLILLRKNKKLTQQELAKELNYSDKAVSRWETGESLPDISVLIKICEFYGVEFEWLIHEHKEVNLATKKVKDNLKILTACLVVVCCFAVATIAYVASSIFWGREDWLFFVGAIPLSLIATFVLSELWWGKMTSAILLSCALWTLIASIYSFFIATNHTWTLFLLGIPLQAIIILIYFIRKK